MYFFTQPWSETKRNIFLITVWSFKLLSVIVVGYFHTFKSKYLNIHRFLEINEKCYCFIYFDLIPNFVFQFAPPNWDESKNWFRSSRNVASNWQLFLAMTSKVIKVIFKKIFLDCCTEVFYLTCYHSTNVLVEKISNLLLSKKFAFLYLGTQFLSSNYNFHFFKEGCNRLHNGGNDSHKRQSQLWDQITCQTKTS